jgi:outer membrane protein OmpA-like peptidoglycan-associated protein/tetratricopeptide (TPR) repeat protein
MAVTNIYAQNIKFEDNNFPNRENDLKKALSNIHQGEQFLFEAETMLFGKGIDIRHKAKAIDMVSKGLVYFLQANDFNAQSAQLNYTIGKSYLYVGDFAKALKFLKKALSLDEKGFKDIHYLIGQTHHYLGEFEQAIELYGIAARTYGNETEMSDIIGKKIKECKYAQELVSDAVDVRVESVGAAVNTEGMEYLPIITNGDEVLFFERFSEGRNRLYAAERISDGWKAAVETNQSFLLPEKETLTELTLVNKSGTPALTKWFSVNIGSQQQMGQGYYESLATLSKSYDNRPIAFFSSNRHEGLGGFDIFMSQRNKKGNWERPHNFGEINTVNDEFGVALHPSSQILYFSSNGLQTMGGYDIFKTEYDGRQWSKPENLGYPINSTADDIVYSISDDGNRLYFSSNRLSGKGGYDIYRVNFLPGVMPRKMVTSSALNATAEAIGTISTDPVATVSDFSVDADITTLSGVAKYPAAMHGFISDKQTYMPLTVSLRLLDKSNGSEEVIESNNKGEFYATLSAGGAYRITVDIPEYRPYTEDFKVSEDVGQKLTKNINLSPLNVVDYVETVAEAIIEEKQPEPAVAPETQYEDDVVVLTPFGSEEQSPEVIPENAVSTSQPLEEAKPEIAPEDQLQQPVEAGAGEIAAAITLTAEEISAQPAEGSISSETDDSISYEEDIVVLEPIVPLYEAADSVLENREYPVDLKVYVSDDKTLQPLAVSVKLVAKNTEVENMLATDDKGMLEVTIASGNTYRLTVESAGYLMKEEEFEVAQGPGQVLTHNITLSPIAPEVKPEQVVAEVLPEIQPEIVEQPVITPEMEVELLEEKEPVVETAPEPVLEEVAETPEIEIELMPEAETVPEPVFEEVVEEPEPEVEPAPVVEEPVVETAPEQVFEEVVETPEPEVEPAPVVEEPVVETAPEPVVEKVKPVAPAPEPVLVAISGSIVGTDTKKPVTNVMATLTDVTRGITEEIKVDEQGKFNANAVAGSKYSLKITAMGYQPVVQDVATLPKSKKMNIPVKLNPVTGTFVASIYFDFDRAALNEKAEQTLQQVIAILNQGNKVSLTGYSDNLGGQGYNKRLSERRVEVVNAYLRAHGIQSGNIEISWKGLSEPAETNLTQSGRKLNNRVEVWTK